MASLVFSGRLNVCWKNAARKPVEEAEDPAWTALSRTAEVILRLSATYLAHNGKKAGLTVPRPLSTLDLLA